MTNLFNNTQGVSSDIQTKFLQQIEVINALVQIVNVETQKYNQMQSFTKEKIILATEINNANIQVLNKKFDLVISHIADIYERLDVLTQDFLKRQ